MDEANRAWRAALLGLLPSLVFVATSALLGCRDAKNHVKPDPATDARTIDAAPDPGPGCFRLSTCGLWQGCVLASPERLPFSMYDGGTPITSGRWYRFRWNDRPNEVGSLGKICSHDAGSCSEGLQHSIPCLPVFNQVDADYRCELVDSVCTKVMEPAAKR